MKKLILNFCLLFCAAALSACATSGSSRDRDDRQTLADKWDEDEKKQEERTKRPSAQEQLGTATDNALGRTNDSLGNTGRLIGR